MRTQGLPEKSTIDKRGANTTAIEHYNRDHHTAILIRHSKYLNHLIEQDHRAVKRLVRPMLGFKSFWAARCTIAGMEVMHAIRKGQLETTRPASQAPAEQFYALAAWITISDNFTRLHLNFATKPNATGAVIRSLYPFPRYL
jgi:putative transposase